MLKKNGENKNENKLGEEETSDDVVENLEKIKELDEEMEEREKKEKERMLQLERQKVERKKYSFKKDPSKVFKRKKLKYFVPGGKGEKKMLKVVTRGIKGIKSKQGEEFARGLKKFADESVKVPTKPTTLKKITMINYLKELKKEKYGPLKKSQIRKIRKTFFSGGGQKGILARGKKNAAGSSQTRDEKKFSISRRVDKGFDDRGGGGRSERIRKL